MAKMAGKDQRMGWHLQRLRTTMGGELEPVKGQGQMPQAEGQVVVCAEAVREAPAGPQVPG